MRVLASRSAYTMRAAPAAGFLAVSGGFSEPFQSDPWACHGGACPDTGCHEARSKAWARATPQRAVRMHSAAGATSATVIAMVEVVRVLVIGGLDPCGGAGITADARVLQLHGAQALPIAVALTVQNRHGFTQCAEVAAELWQAAFAAALADGPIAAIKLGLLASASQAASLAALLAPLARQVPLVVDPVLSATAGGYQAPGALAAVYREQLVPIAAVFTPNLPERAAVLGALAPAEACRRGCRAVLTKGGHGTGGPLVDVLSTSAAEFSFAHPRQPVGPVHGTGCALASSLAAHLAHGRSAVDAAGASIAWLQRCLAAMGAAPDHGLPRPLALVSETSTR